MVTVGVLWSNTPMLMTASSSKPSKRLVTSTTSGFKLARNASRMRSAASRRQVFSGWRSLTGPGAYQTRMFSCGSNPSKAARIGSIVSESRSLKAINISWSPRFLTSAWLRASENRPIPRKRDWVCAPCRSITIRIS